MDHGRERPGSAAPPPPRARDLGAKPGAQGGAGELKAVEERFREQRLHRRVALPYDERLRTMLDSGTYTLEALDRTTRIPIKQLGMAVAEQLA